VEAIDRIATETRFSGVVRIDVGDDVVFSGAYGLANRAYGVPNTQDSQLAIASGVKALTALTVVSLIEEGRLSLGTTARSVLGTDLPLIADDVTVEQLLAHRSGIGDYLDEEADLEIDEYVMPVPVQDLRTAEDYLRVLDGHPQKFAPDERFSYCNGGYVVLAIIAERVAGEPFPELVGRRVCGPAGMHATEFLQSDQLPRRAAVGYLAVDGAKTNVFHLPVRGSGDGGIYATTADVHAMWNALFSGQVVPQHWVSEMIRPRSEAPLQSMRYGLGFWLHESRDIVMLEGHDAGVSFRTVHDPSRRITHTVISNTSEGAWPISRLLAEELAT
jgi:CubicO group peptidase (beta-lactamase class C family)